MKKHFLLLLWMALLPLAGWAQDILEVKPYAISKYYGQDDSSITLLYKVTGKSLTEDEQSALRATLSISRNGVNASEAVGDYSYTLKCSNTSVISGYTVAIDGNSTFSIVAMPLTHEDIEVADIPNQSWTGSPIAPTLTITNNGQTLKEGVDYEVSWEDNTNGPTATGTITALGSNYTGSIENVTFAIKQGIENALITLTGVDDLEYDGSAKTPATITVKLAADGEPLSSEDYDVSYPDGNTNAGPVTVKVTGKGSYTGDASTTYTIKKKAVAEDKITYTLGDAPVYNGEAKLPNLSAVKENGNTLDEASYEVTNASTNAGAATATLTLKGNYEGTKTINYTIAQAAFSSLTVEYTSTDVYNNVDFKPAVTVKNGETIVDASNYDVVYKDDNDETDVEDLKSAGTKHIVIKGNGSGNYDNSAIATKDYTITQRALTITADPKTIGIGSDINPTATIDNYAEGHSLKDLSTSGNGKVTFTYKDEDDHDVADPSAAVGTYTIIPAAGEFNNPNYTYTNLVNGTLKVTAGQITAQVAEQNVTFGAEFAAGSIVHKSGLAPGKEGDFNTGVNVTGITGYTVYEADGTTLATKVTDQNFYPAGTYVVKAVGTATYTGYEVSLVAGTWTVEPKDISAVTFDAGGLTREYSGAEDVPSTTGKMTWAGLTLAEKTDYTVALKVDAGDASIDNMNVSDGGKTGKVVITAVDNGNYTGSVEKTYTITKATLDITAYNYVDGDEDLEHNAWVYGTEEPVYKAKVEGLVGRDENVDLTGETAPTGFTGRLVVSRTSNTTVGMHTAALKPSGVTNPNYTINLINGDLEVSTGSIYVKVKDVTVKYGETPTFALEYVSGLAAEEVDNFSKIVTFSTTAADYGYDADEMKNVNTEGYTLNYTGTATSTNYKVLFENDVKTGKLIVNQRPVKFTAKPQTTAYSDLGDLLAALEVSDTYIDQTVDDDYLSLVTGDAITDVIAKIEATSTRISNDNEIVLTEKEGGKAANYDITLVSGTLTITSAGVPTIALNRVAQADFGGATDTAAQLIEDYSADATNSVDVTFTFPGHTMKKETWYSWVLPFATCVKDISKAFGYAVVDILNEGYTGSADDVAFSLWMGDIAANQPFILKVYQDITPEQFAAAATTIKFESVHIDNTPYSAVDQNGNSFVGTYEGIVGLTADQYLFRLGVNDYSKGGEGSVIRPLGAYINFVTSAPEHTIFIEELNGSTTAISTLTGDAIKFNGEGWYTLNGLKLQNAPTEKGIYILNGKKVVIK